MANLWWRRSITTQGKRLVTGKIEFTAFHRQISTDSDIKIKRFEEIPGPVTIPFLKSAWVFLPFIGHYNVARLESSYLKMFKHYGKLVRIELPKGSPLLILFDKDDIRKIFAAEGKYPYRGGMVSLRKYRESKPEMYPNLGLFLLDGEKWHDLRRLAQKPMLRIPAVRLYIKAMENVSTDFLERLRIIRDKDMEVRNLVGELFRWALESVGVFALDKRLGCLDKNLTQESEPQRLINALNDTFESTYELEVASGWSRLFPKKNYEKLVRAQDYFTGIVYKYLNQALEEFKERGPRKEGEETYLLDEFLMTSQMDMDQVKGVVLDLFLAGIESTSYTVAFSLYHLAKSKDYQQKLQEEVRRALPTKDSPITPDTLDNIPFLRAFIKETLRLYAVIGGTARILDQDITLSGYHIPKKTVLAMMASVTSRLEEYFELPEKFLPERWLDDATEDGKSQRQNAGLKQKYSAQPFAMLPFSHGARMCIGRRFAEQEMYILLIKIIQNFILDYRHEPIQIRQGIINAPDRPLHMVFKDRE